MPRKLRSALARGVGLLSIAPGVVVVVIAHADIVGVDVGARLDRLRRHADDLAIPAHRLPHRMVAHRGLVPGGNALDRDHTRRDFGARHERVARDDHAVALMQADEGAHLPRASATAALAAVSRMPLSLLMVTSLNPIPMARLA